MVRKATLLSHRASWAEIPVPSNFRRVKQEVAPEEPEKPFTRKDFVDLVLDHNLVDMDLVPPFRDVGRCGWLNSVVQTNRIFPDSVLRS